MAITFSQEIFEKICSSATNSTAEVYDMIAPHFDDTLQSINRVLLGDMADKLESVPGLEQAVTKLVCLRTYQEQIPELDLVLTPVSAWCLTRIWLRLLLTESRTCCSKSQTLTKILMTVVWSCWSALTGQRRHRLVSIFRT